jgi:putative spermidine/putrescine transport system permease protein
VYFLRYSALGTDSQYVGLQEFRTVIGDSYYTTVLVRTIVLAAVVSVVCVVVSLPVAQVIAAAGRGTKITMVLLCLFPMLAGGVVRAIGWLAVLGYGGPLTHFLLWAHVMSHDRNLAQNQYSVGLVLVMILSPVTILILHAALEDLNPEVVRASLSLGATRARTFWRVTLPQLAPVVFAGMMLTFVLAINSYDTPTLIGGGRIGLMSPAIYHTIMQDFDWPGGAVLTILLLACALLAIAVYGWFFQRLFGAWRRAVM